MLTGSACLWLRLVRRLHRQRLRLHAPGASRHIRADRHRHRSSEWCADGGRFRQRPPRRWSGCDRIHGVHRSLGGAAPLGCSWRADDPNAYNGSADPALLFDTASHVFYSSRPGDSRELWRLGVDAGGRRRCLFTGPPSVAADLSDRPIRAWPDGLDVVDMVMAGPQPTGVSTASADSQANRSTITGAGLQRRRPRRSLRARHPGAGRFVDAR